MSSGSDVYAAFYCLVICFVGLIYGNRLVSFCRLSYVGVVVVYVVLSGFYLLGVHFPGLLVWGWLLLL